MERPGPGGPWVSAYALDFLDRARAAGFEVDERALRRSPALCFPPAALEPDVGGRGGGGRLWSCRARALQPRGSRHRAPLREHPPRAGGERSRPCAVGAGRFIVRARGRHRIRALRRPSAPGGSRYATYGSGLRDAAALVAVAAALDSDVLPEAAAHLRELSVEDSYTSTQEKAWMVVAAWELNRAMEGAPLTVDGARTMIGEGNVLPGVRLGGSEGRRRDDHEPGSPSG